MKDSIEDAFTVEVLTPDPEGNPRALVVIEMAGPSGHFVFDENLQDRPGESGLSLALSEDEAWRLVRSIVAYFKSRSPSSRNPASPGG